MVIPPALIEGLSLFLIRTNGKNAVRYCGSGTECGRNPHGFNDFLFSCPKLLCFLCMKIDTEWALSCMSDSYCYEAFYFLRKCTLRQRLLVKVYISLERFGSKFSYFPKLFNIGFLIKFFWHFYLL